MHAPPRHHYPGHYRHRVWAVNGLTVTALGLIPLSAMAAAGQRAGEAITPAVQAVPPPPTVGSQPTGVLELITAPSTTASTAVATDGGKAPGDTETPPRVCRCQPRRTPQTAIPAPTTPTQAPASTSTATRTSALSSLTISSAPSSTRSTPPTSTNPTTTAGSSQTSTGTTATPTDTTVAVPTITVTEEEVLP